MNFSQILGRPLVFLILINIAVTMAMFKFASPEERVGFLLMGYGLGAALQMASCRISEHRKMVMAMDADIQSEIITKMISVADVNAFPEDHPMRVRAVKLAYALSDNGWKGMNYAIERWELAKETWLEHLESCALPTQEADS